MPQSRTIQTFEFSELSDNAKDKVRHWLEEGFDPDWITDTLREELSQRGLDGLTEKGPWWTLYVQGAGVFLEGTFTLDTITPIQGDEGHGDQAADEAHIEAIRAAIPQGTDPAMWLVTVEYSDYYGTNLSVEYVWHFDDDDALETAVVAAQDTLSELVAEWLDDIRRCLYRIAEAEYEYQSSDEAIAETCEANQYIFLADGSPAHHLVDRDE